jgi:hypothetical protein
MTDNVSHTVISAGRFYKGVTKDHKSPLQIDRALTYEIGTEVVAPDLDEDPNDDCGAGINICRTLAEALRYCKEGTVLIVEVPDGETIIDAGNKLRVRRVKVVARVNLCGADLGGAYLGGAYLGGADLGGADLGGANLRGADLRGADLYGADLRWAYLGGADLRDADLRGAYLGGAHLREADLDNTHGDRDTILPAGYELSATGLIVRTP